MALIIGELSKVTGQVKKAHLELELKGRKLQDFKNLPPEDQIDILEEEGHIFFDDCTVNYEEVKSIVISE